jgi:monofunctional biosynthetic peptidoglycan transglycosylase
MKRILMLLLFALVACLIYIVVSLALLQPVSDLADRKFTTTIQVKDWQGAFHPFVVGPKNRDWTPSGQIPPEMKWAVILAEDSNFYKHEGFDVKAIREAVKYDLEKKSFARGASTITQQAAKNLFLSREKTLTRKIKEVYLAWRMEQELTKGRIIELYLNTVELGPMVYGIGHGSRYYFGKPAAALTPRECAFLTAMLPGPRLAYNPYKNLGRVLKRSDMILRLMRRKGVLAENEYQAALAQSPNVGRLQQKVDESIRKDVVFNSSSSAQKPSDPPDDSDLQSEKPGDSRLPTAEPPLDSGTEETPAQPPEPPPEKR